MPKIGSRVFILVTQRNKQSNKIVNKQLHVAKSQRKRKIHTLKQKKTQGKETLHKQTK